MSKRSVSASVRQQTLFDCVKRKKQSFNDSDDSASVGPSTMQGQTHQQGNFVTVQNPSGHSTIIINADSFSGTSATCTNMRGETQSSTTIENDVPSTCQQPPSDIASGPNEKPVQPSRSTVRFPPTLVGTKKRYFNPDWFKTYSWLEYSVERDAAFCFPCRHFSTKSGRAEDTFTKESFRDWKHATGKEGVLQGHASCLTHIQTVSSWHEYKQNEECGTSVVSRLDSERNEQICLNRHYLRSVAEVITTLVQSP